LTFVVNISEGPKRAYNHASFIREEESSIALLTVLRGISRAGLAFIISARLAHVVSVSEVSIRAGVQAVTIENNHRVGAFTANVFGGAEKAVGVSARDTNRGRQLSRVERITAVINTRAVFIVERRFTFRTGGSI